MFTDIDECREGKCQNGHCTNQPGSFTCVCPPGFDVSPDGERCTDHDECAEIGMCTNGICINMDGSFKCHCKPGYKLSPTGYACVGKSSKFSRLSKFPEYPDFIKFQTLTNVMKIQEYV